MSIFSLDLYVHHLIVNISLGKFIKQQIVNDVQQCKVVLFLHTIEP